MQLNYHDESPLIGLVGRMEIWGGLMSVVVEAYDNGSGHSEACSSK
jgi:hypothetical protein